MGAVEELDLELEEPNNESHRGAYITKIAAEAAASSAAAAATATLLAVRVLRFGSNFYLLLWLSAVFISIFSVFFFVFVFCCELGSQLWAAFVFF